MIYNLEVQYEIFHVQFVINEICEWDLFLWGISRGHVVGTRFMVGTEAVAGEVDWDKKKSQKSLMAPGS